MKKGLLLLLICYAMNVSAQKIIPLYEGKIPNARETEDQESAETRPDGTVIISKISRPTLSIYRPEKGKANGTAVLICPGGGYWIVAAKHEGYDVAEKFAANGITAFVLKYRIPSDETMTDRTTGPLQDAQTAMNYIHAHAGEYGIRRNRIGIMGFSAGGHLAASVGTHYKKPVLPGLKPASVKPDFMILVYPVISFSDSIGHLGSREQLLGKTPSKEQVEAYSNEQLVDASTPPTFLVHAKDDTGVKVENSIDFYEALKKHGVPADIYLYEKGGHGFGMNNPTSDVKWMDLVLEWMGKIKK